jgi:hypothetical protein
MVGLPPHASAFEHDPIALEANFPVWLRKSKPSIWECQDQIADVRPEILGTKLVATIGLAGADVELPAMPGAADDLTQLGVLDVAGIARLRQPDQRALAQRCALMRAAIEQAEIFALDVEDRDRPVVDGDEFARPRRQFTDGGDDVFGHQETPYSFLALPR